MIGLLRSANLKGCLVSERSKKAGVGWEGGGGAQ